jgi:UDP-N-acetylmuramyl pentapeptide phosphotransferase/UDP-N-acetylglucosamine-1-phosphate transferase
MMLGVMFAAAGAVSFGIVWLIRRNVARLGGMDIPNARSSHIAPTPRGGGLAIVMVTLAGTALLQAWLGDEPGPALVVYLAGGALIAWVGWVDDRHSLPVWFRLAVHIAAALLVVAGCGAFTRLRLPLAGPVDLGVLGMPLTLIWIVGMINAYNFMDGIDGLAGGQTVLAGLLWAVVGWPYGLLFVAGMGLLMAAASLGFLLHNWPPARIFMGDAGSGFLGFSFALLPLLASAAEPGLPVVGVLILWPFVFDTTFTLARRLSRRENVFQAHRSHLYQRLVIAGLSHPRVTLLYLGLAGLGGLAGLAWTRVWPGAEAATLLVPCAGLGLWASVVWIEKRTAAAALAGERPSEHE